MLLFDINSIGSSIITTTLAAVHSGDLFWERQLVESSFFLARVIVFGVAVVVVVVQPKLQPQLQPPQPNGRQSGF